MKKLLVFIFIVILLCCTNLLCVQELTLKNLFPNSNFEVYLREQQDEFCGYNKVLNGAGEIIVCREIDVDFLCKNINCVDGFTVKISRKLAGCLPDLINVVRLDFINNCTYGYSVIFNKLAKKYGFLRKNIVIGDNFYNFQLKFDQNFILIGFPVILGSY